jgi:hypothetical protein
MTMASPFAPKRPIWLAASIAVSAMLLAIYAVWAWWVPWRPGRAGGLTFGTIAALIFFFDGLYPVRRRLLAWPLHTAQAWLQLHLYGGIVASLCVFIHVGFALPRGTMGWWLFGLSLWTTLTGLFGVMLQKWIPRVVSGSLRVEALAARMPVLTAKLLGDADEVMRGASDRLFTAYQSDIRPGLLRPQPMWAYVANVQSGRGRYTQSLERLERTAADRDRLEELKSIVSEKAELDVHLSLQRALRAWLILHVPPAIVLLGLLAVHIFAVLYL